MIDLDDKRLELQASNRVAFTAPRRPRSLLALLVAVVFVVIAWWLS